MFESRKRAREDDDIEWQTELPDLKRSCALPFRTSPTTKHTNTFSQSPRTIPRPLLTPALTPTETSEDEGELKNPFRSPTREKSAQLTLNSTITIEEPRNFDMEIDSSQPADSPQPWRSIESSQPSPCTIIPRTLSYNPQEVNNGGRIPTPIYGHFNHVDRSMEMETPDQNYAQTQQEIAHDLFLRRRLPSPISEDEAMGGMLGRLDMGSQSPFKTNKMWGRGGFTKGKMTISMGYRTDCEKCKWKVPGHYNHFVRL
ncbi:MAG: hypothetical protein LQ338_008339 [Usnochroma carphineum]|nr:MAG: hypothetical protein LQ338_008339 [Usnochroma carphineum]